MTNLHQVEKLNDSSSQMLNEKKNTKDERVIVELRQDVNSQKTVAAKNSKDAEYVNYYWPRESRNAATPVCIAVMTRSRL